MYSHISGVKDEQTEMLEKNLLVTIDEGISASKDIHLEEGCPFKQNQMNINADLTVPVCCLVFNRDNTVSNNFLEDTIEKINQQKANAKICDECMKLNLPQYNMGFNKCEWERIARTKVKNDKGSGLKLAEI